MIKFLTIIDVLFGARREQRIVVHLYTYLRPTFKIGQRPKRFGAVTTYDNA